jgi:hypothetical protein
MIPVRLRNVRLRSLPSQPFHKTLQHPMTDTDVAAASLAYGLGRNDCWIVAGNTKQVDQDPPGGMGVTITESPDCMMRQTISSVGNCAFDRHTLVAQHLAVIPFVVAYCPAIGENVPFGLHEG